MPLANVERARKVLAGRGAAFVVASTRENTLYLSGIDNTGQVSFPYTEQSYVVAPAFNVTAGILVLSLGRVESGLAAYDSIAEVVPFGRFPRAAWAGGTLDTEELSVQNHGPAAAAEAFDALATALELAGATGEVVAVDERGPGRDLLGRLSDRFPHARFIPAAELMREIRAVKTPDELDRLVRAVEINEAGFRAVFDAARTGVTEEELRRRFRTTVTENGGTPGHCLLKFGRRMALFQDPRGDARLAAGDSIFLDAGASWAGYRSDLGRMVSFGPPSERFLELYAASKAGQTRAIEYLVPGRPIAEVFRVAVEAARAGGNPDFERSHTGHAVGLEWNDYPMISGTVNAIVEEGMVLEVELPYYELGFGGAHIEDTVVIDGRGARRLSTLERELRILDVD